MASYHTQREKTADMAIPDRFLSAIGGDPGNCVLVVGAGLSKTAVREHGAGIPDWDQLMQLMVKHLEDARRCDRAKTQQLRAMLKDDPPTLPGSGRGIFEGSHS